MLASILAMIVPALTVGSELRQTPIVKIVQQVGPSVVSIRGEKTVTTTVSQVVGSDAPHRVNGMGTGVIIDSRGYILTNYHVVDGVREIQVTGVDEKRHTARLVARDIETDLAIIKINVTEKLPVVPIGTSSDLMTGESVIAVGNAFGYEHTVTRGIISSLHRAVQISDAQYYDDLIQTDASINPGNSGGPLLNIVGEMIGINVAVRAGAQGIGFAIPVDKAMAIAANLMGSAGMKAWHGVAPDRDAPASLSGMKVGSVEPKSPAAECGLQAGDVITAVDDAEVRRALDFQRAVIDHKPGDTIAISVRRGSKSVSLSLDLAEMPEAMRPAVSPAWDVLGVELRPITPADFHQKYQASRYRGGLTVVDVRPDSPAAEQGIRPGDVLVGLHIWETVSPDNVSYILKRPDFNTINPLKFFILRGTETLYGYLSVSMKVAQHP